MKRSVVWTSSCLAVYCITFVRCLAVESEVSVTEKATLSPDDLDLTTLTSLYGNEEQIDIEEVTEVASNDTGATRLYSGTKVTVKGTYPYALHVSSSVTPGDTARGCTAALLTPEYAITAASCVHDATSITVTAATLDATDGDDTTKRSATAIIHPHYYSNTQDHDIALLKLSKEYILSSTIGTINIAYKQNTDDSHDTTEKTMRVLAFGEIAADTATFALNTQSMKALAHSKCIREMKKRNIKLAINQECLFTESGTLGGCNQADKGGIVTYRFGTDSQYTLAGVLNYYYTCASGTPNLFTRVGPYWDLIRKYIPTYDNVG